MKKILIVEDEISIAELERDYLELSGFEVDIEQDGDKGLDRALKNDYDLMILDIMLPGTDGYEICRRVREIKNTPILMVTAKKEDIDKIRGLGMGADDYITKPFSPSELVARVKAHLNRYERLTGGNEHRNDIIEMFYIFVIVHFNIDIIFSNFPKEFFFQNIFCRSILIGSFKKAFGFGVGGIRFSDICNSFKQRFSSSFKGLFKRIKFVAKLCECAYNAISFNSKRMCRLCRLKIITHKVLVYRRNKTRPSKI